MPACSRIRQSQAMTSCCSSIICSLTPASAFIWARETANRLWMSSEISSSRAPPRGRAAMLSCTCCCFASAWRMRSCILCFSTSPSCREQAYALAQTHASHAPPLPLVSSDYSIHARGQGPLCNTNLSNHQAASCCYLLKPRLATRTEDCRKCLHSHTSEFSLTVTCITLTSLATFSLRRSSSAACSGDILTPSSPTRVCSSWIPSNSACALHW